ncbi:ImmA/IrrE family metallo-endopeptidase [Mycolicibacterium sphagni]|uniref:ImmA/IrrE family metallo-endopeptidase n=1 Tax=Mycolicibacterium sphagni TaxID=1786 RepID=A0ABX2K769_9MYCO|nr:ImmA/IrrE family metallo-endopeptidase [Mycolicibacterium sphagni]
MIDPNQRLRNLRQLNGMTQKAFAAELGIGQAALSQIERGDRPLTAQHMVIARRRFNIPFDFFEAPPITYGPNDLNFRTRKLTRAQQDRAVTMFGLIEQEVRNKTDIANSTSSLNAADGDDVRARPLREVEALAAATRQLIGVRSDKVINNVTRCIERLGILVTGLPAWDPNARIDGISSPRRTEEPFVAALDLDKPGDRLRFSAAHELGHILVHTESKPLSREARETEADTFASAFLLPREAMLEELSPTLTLAGYSRIKARWGVSMQAVIRRSFDLDVIDRDRYRSLQIQISSRGWRKDEPVDIPKETPAIPTPDIGGFRQIVNGDNVVSIFDRPLNG